MSDISEQRACHEALVSVSNSVRVLSIQKFEAQPKTAGALVELMTTHANRALEVLELVLERFDPSDLDPSETLADVPGSAASDTAFITQLHLRQRLDRLVRSARTNDPWLVIGEAASLRRHIIKSMAQVEQAVCAELDRDAQLEGSQERELALASRDAYQRYIRAVRRVSAQIDAGELTMIPALRLCATNIAI